MRLMAFVMSQLYIDRQTTQQKPGKNSVAPHASSVFSEAKGIGPDANSVGSGANAVGPDANSVVSDANRVRAPTGCWMETSSKSVCKAQQVFA